MRQTCFVLVDVVIACVNIVVGYCSNCRFAAMDITVEALGTVELRTTLAASGTTLASVGSPLVSLVSLFGLVFFSGDQDCHGKSQPCHEEKMDRRSRFVGRLVSWKHVPFCNEIACFKCLENQTSRPEPGSCGLLRTIQKQANQCSTHTSHSA